MRDALLTSRCQNWWPTTSKRRGLCCSFGVGLRKTCDLHKLRVCLASMKIKCLSLGLSVRVISIIHLRKGVKSSLIICKLTLQHIQSVETLFLSSDPGIAEVNLSKRSHLYVFYDNELKLHRAPLLKPHPIYLAPYSAFVGHGCLQHDEASFLDRHNKLIAFMSFRVPSLLRMSFVMPMVRIWNLTVLGNDLSKQKIHNKLFHIGETELKWAWVDFFYLPNKKNQNLFLLKTLKSRGHLPTHLSAENIVIPTAYSLNNNHFSTFQRHGTLLVVCCKGGYLLTL